jgi:hypothetical protein
VRRDPLRKRASKPTPWSATSRVRPTSRSPPRMAILIGAALRRGTLLAPC